MRYTIDYSPEADDHLRTLTARQQAVILDAVEEQLTHQAEVETRNRKPMRPNPVAPWELRVGDFRVYYDVRRQPHRLVIVMAIGMKRRNRVWIGGEVVEL